MGKVESGKACPEFTEGWKVASNPSTSSVYISLVPYPSLLIALYSL